MERVGPYDVHEPLGRGGMGAVFRAVDSRSGQEVALKVLATTDERARRRLVLEARALARLRHGNVVSLLDAGEDRGRPWLALELVRGRSLQERLDREGPLEPREAAALTSALAAGLAHAHREGVLHRDLKPANVLLPDVGEPKLTDFGLAGFTNDLSQSRLTTSGTLMGSPGYWSPEQATGKVSSIGPLTDVYGLGGLLYAALTGRPPIVGASLPEVLMATEGRRPEPPGRDRVLDAIALRCLEKVPTDRFASVDEVARALSLYLAPAAARSRSRGPAIAGVAGLAVVALALAIPRPTAPTPPPTTVSPAPTASITTVTQAPPPPVATPAPAPAPVPEVVTVVTDVLLEAVEERGRSPAESIAIYDRAIELDPLDATAYFNRGVSRSKLGDHRGALADFDRAIELDPRPARPYRHRSLTRDRLGDGRGALSDLDRAIVLEPRHAPSYKNRGVLREKLGDDRGAVADYETALRLEPEAPWAERVRGLVARARGRVAAAEGQR